jgi:hypothetical protein
MNVWERYRSSQGRNKLNSFLLPESDLESFGVGEDSDVHGTISNFHKLYQIIV